MHCTVSFCVTVFCTRRQASLLYIQQECQLFALLLRCVTPAPFCIVIFLCLISLLRYTYATFFIACTLKHALVYVLVSGDVSGGKQLEEIWCAVPTMFLLWWLLFGITSASAAVVVVCYGSVVVVINGTVVLWWMRPPMTAVRFCFTIVTDIAFCCCYARFASSYWWFECVLAYAYVCFMVIGWESALLLVHCGAAVLNLLWSVSAAARESIAM